MPTFRVNINQKELDNQIQKILGNSPMVKEAALKEFRVYFYRAKRAMMARFDRHPVTQELQMGPKGLNISNTLDGYGNLFSFIGFESGTDPVAPLRELLLKGTTYKQTVFRQGGWHFIVDAPTKDEIHSVTPMPWEGGNSWAEGVERGISGLSHYMYKRWITNSSSRSKQGFQLPWENLEDSVFQPKPYMTKILARFRDHINNINSADE